jgi:ribonuclease G
MQYKPEAEWPVELDAVFDQGLAETVGLAGGGSIHFEAARTAVLIDVDSGTPATGSLETTGLAFNLAAAEIIARQIRLRNLGGGIVIDFVGLEDRKSRERVRDALTEALMPDPARPQILGWTRLGHIELVRPRRGRSLAEALLKPGPGGALVKTAVTMAHEVLRALRREARAQPGRRWLLTVNPDVAAALAGVAAASLRAIEERFGRAIAIETDPSLGPDRFQITSV